LFSGILQQGYAFGYLLAAVVYWIVFPLFGWRGLFVAGALPAFLVLYIRARVPESPVWLRQQHAIGDFWRQALFVLKRHWALFLYVILLMTAFNAMSHGAQDMYQTFLGEQRHYGVTQKAMTGIIYAVGAICGGTVVGHLSQKWGRRRSIALCCALGIVLIPLWAFSPGYTLLVIGGFAMQFMVQGAWGIVPVHLNELSPDAVRGTFPGFGGPVGPSFPRCQRASRLRKGTRPFHAGDFRRANFPRRYRSRKTRKGILVFVAEFYREPAGPRLMLAGSGGGRNWAAILGDGR
jgi:SHS family lactate transporter-like MFS transporter